MADHAARNEAMPDSPDTVFVECPIQIAGRRQIVERLFARIEGAAFEVAYRVAQNISITGDGDIPGDNIRQPKIIIGTAGSDAPDLQADATSVGHPPLQIAWDACEQDLFAGQVGPGMKNRQHVLKLIPEPVGAARLVKPTPAKDPAGQGLIKQPAIPKDIDSIIGRGELHGSQNRIPVFLYAIECERSRRRAGQFLDELFRVLRVRGASHQENNFLF